MCYAKRARDRKRERCGERGGQFFWRVSLLLTHEIEYNVGVRCTASASALSFTNSKVKFVTTLHTHVWYSPIWCIEEWLDLRRRSTEETTEKEKMESQSNICTAIALMFSLLCFLLCKAIKFLKTNDRVEQGRIRINCILLYWSMQRERAMRGD